MEEEPVKLGKYNLLRHLATGGMAEIWLAEQEGPGGFAKELVIKRILPNFVDDSKFTTMFLDEARLAAQLSHPKIAQIYELGETEGQYFIAMEYIRGIDLDVLLTMAMDEGEPMPIGIVCKIVTDVLEALDYAHDYTDRDGQPFNLVHRDVSPHNVLVSNDGIVKLCDFGVAKAKANQTKTQPGAVKGKFAYMAPEQIQNASDLDRRADIFAAGILFYELLTGVKPFGDDLAAVNSIIAESHTDPREHRPDVPPKLVDVIDRALRKNRDDRYHDAHAMVRDIEAYVRADGNYVGDRELARYVRNMQGIPVTRHSQPSVGIDENGAGENGGSEPSEPTIDPLGDTGDQKTPTAEQIAADRLDRTTDREPKVPTAEIDDVVDEGERTNTVTVDTTVDGDQPAGIGKLIAIFGVIILGVIAALGVVGYFLLGSSTPTDNPKQVVEEKEVAEEPKADRTLLTHPGGRLVVISTTPQSEIWVGGKLVADTPFQTTLRPGEYKAEFRTAKAKRQRTFKVKDEQGLQPIKLQL